MYHNHRLEFIFQESGVSYWQCVEPVLTNASYSLFRRTDCTYSEFQEEDCLGG